MSDLRELYQEMILEHARRPRNLHAQDAPGGLKAAGFNALCGDRIDVYVKLAGDVVEEVSFEGSGCAISTASASMMTQALCGKTVAEAEALFRRFHRLVTGESQNDSGTVDLGKLAVFAGVCEFPARVKCASLAWHTLVAALHAQDGIVSTEEGNET